jgi:hypothetical protein
VYNNTDVDCDDDDNNNNINLLVKVLCTQFYGPPADLFLAITFGDFDLNLHKK